MQQAVRMFKSDGVGGVDAADGENVRSTCRREGGDLCIASAF
jgi:hypothetical protein